MFIWLSATQREHKLKQRGIEHDSMGMRQPRRGPGMGIKSLELELKSPRPDCLQPAPGGGSNRVLLQVSSTGGEMTAPIRGGYQITQEPSGILQPLNWTVTDMDDKCISYLYRSAIIVQH